MIIIGCLLVTLVASGGSFSFVIFYVVWELKKNDKFCRKRTVRSHFLGCVLVASYASKFKLVLTNCHKDILLSESLDVIVALLQPAPELAPLVLLFIIICEPNVRRDRGSRLIELLKELTVPKINFSHTWRYPIRMRKHDISCACAKCDCSWYFHNKTTEPSRNWCT